MTTFAPAHTATSKRTLNVLHVGVANRGVWPLDKCNTSTGFRSAAICDVTPSAVEEALKRTGLPASAAYADLDAALKHPGIDCAIVCTPTKFHVPMAKKCIAAGIPVLIEKGMAPDFASAKDLAATVAASRAIACVAQNYRYASCEKQIYRAVNDPSHPCYLGSVHTAQYIQNRVRPIPRTLTYPFASVWDMSCHHFDNLLYWFGPIKAMTAHSWRASFSAYEHDNNTSAQILFASGVQCVYLHTHDAARANLEVQIHGENGALVRREDTIDFNTRPLEQFGSRPIQPVPPEHAEGESDLLRDFHAYITAGIEPGVSVRHNLETMAACEMMVRSITLKRTVTRDEL